MELVRVLVEVPFALDVQLRREAGLTHFEYGVLSVLAAEPDASIALATLAKRMNSSMSRLSHVLSGLERKGLLKRFPMPSDGRITLAQLTNAGSAKAVDAAPGHVSEVRRLIFDHLDRAQIDALRTICALIGNPAPSTEASNRQQP